VIVWVDDWQLQCCGTPFRRGGRVDWRVRPADTDWLGTVLGPRLPPPPVYAEEHHGGWREGEQRLRAAGTVRAVEAVSCRFASRGSVGMEPVFDSAVLEPVAEADGRHRVTAPLHFVGYLVTLDADVDADADADVEVDVEAGRRTHGSAVAG
jgi:hypothetical protein